MRCKEETLSYEGDEVAEQVSQSSCGCPLPGSAEDRLDGGLSSLVYWKVFMPMVCWN